MKHASCWAKRLVILTLFALFPRAFGLDAAPVHDPHWAMHFWHALGEPKDGQMVAREFSARAGVSISGPLLPGSRLVRNPSTENYFAADPHFVLQYHKASGVVRLFALPGADQPNPDISWPMGITYDAVRQKPIVVTLGGEGHLLALNDSDGSWQVIRSLNGRDFDSITYKDFDNVFYGVETSGGGELVVTGLTANGEFLRSYRIPNVPFTVGPGSYRSEIIAFPAQLAVVLEAPRTSIHNAESRIYVIDLTTGQSELTYRKEWTTWPPAAKPPMIAMQPAPGPYHPGDTINLKAQGKADEGARIARVEFHANGQLLGRGFETSATSTLSEQIFSYTWSNSVAGKFNVTATATDSRGLIATSTPIQIVVGDDQPNQRPTVSITLPRSGSEFESGAEIHVTVEAKDPDGRVHSVELFDSGRSIGLANEAHTFAPIDGQLFSFTWQNAPAGEHRIVAVARDDRGAAGESTPVLIYVEHPPQTNAFFTLRFLTREVLDRANTVSSLSEVRYSTNAGPVDGGAFIRGLRMVGDGRYLFGAEPHAIYRYDRETHQTTTVTLPSGIGELSWPMGAAFDPTRNKVYVVTLGGEGRLYSYSYTTQTWRFERSMENFDFDSIAYHAPTDALYGVETSTTTNGKATVMVTRLPGQPGEPIRLRVPEVPFSVGNGGDNSELVLVGQKLYLLLESGPNKTTGRESRMYLLDPLKSEVALVTRKEWPSAPLPTLTVAFPTNGSNYVSGMTLALKAAIDGVVPTPPATVNFYTGAQLIGAAARISDAQPLYGFEWKTAAVGEHTITARATVGGIMITSAPVRISISPKPTLTIQMTQPIHGLVHTNNRPMPFRVEAVSQSNIITFVQVMAGNEVIAKREFDPRVILVALPHRVVIEGQWTNPPAGEHHIFASASDTSGAVAATEARTVRIVGTNAPPVVAMVSPRIETIVTNTRPFQLIASAYDTDGGVRSVTFHANGKLIGEGVPSLLAIFPPTYGLSWSNAVAGRYEVTARAVDDRGAATVSAPVIVNVVNGPQPTNTLIRVTRLLPGAYLPGQAFVVRLNAAASRAVEAYAIEDQPPAGWRVSNITHDGAFDEATGKVKFGPFLDHETRTLAYTVVPPATATGERQFIGRASANGVSVAIDGDSRLSIGSQRHPADASPADDMIKLDELSAYAAGWSRSERLTPMSYVTRAAAIWKAGEAYRFDAAAGEPPLCWVPARDLRALAETDETTATRAISSTSVSGFVSVSIAVDVAEEISAYAVEEQIPPGIDITGISDNGRLSADGTAIRWGPFIDNEPRVFTYQIESTTMTEPLLTGTISYDGSVQFVQGAATTAPFEMAVRVAADGSAALQFTVNPNETIAVEAAPTLNGNWSQIKRVTGGLNVNSVSLTNQTSAGAQFYRLRRIP